MRPPIDETDPEYLEWKRHKPPKTFLECRRELGQALTALERTVMAEQPFAFIYKVVRARGWIGAVAASALLVIVGFLVMVTWINR